jgi:hypothetical protein
MIDDFLYMNGDLWSALLSWWPFVILMAAWFLIGRKRILALISPRALVEEGHYGAAAQPETDRATDLTANLEEGELGSSLWFAAMEYYALILNRTYKVFLTDQMLVGAKVRGLVISPPVVPPQMFDQEFWVRTQAAQRYGSVDVISAEFLQIHSANFQIRWNEIAQTEYRSGKKWGMGNVPHSGRLILQLRSGRRRELILLGNQNGNALKERFDHLVKVRS